MPDGKRSIIGNAYSGPEPPAVSLIPAYTFSVETPVLAIPSQVLGSPNEPTQQVVAGEGSTVPVIYGRRRVGGIIAGVGSDSDASGSMILLVVWGMGEVNAVEQVQLNDLDPPGDGPVWSYTNYTGTQTQGVDAMGIRGFGSSYADNFRALPSSPDKWAAAYSVIRVPPYSVNGFPRPTAIIQGRKIKQVEWSYVALNGTSQYFTTPNAAANQISTDDFEISVLLAAIDWTPSSDRVLVSRWNTTGNQRNYRFLLKSTGALSLEVSTNGTAVTTYTSTAVNTLVDGTVAYVRVRFQLDDGANSVAKFGISTDGQTWQQLGNAVTGTQLGSLFAQSTAELRIGADHQGNYLQANIFAARIITSLKLICDVVVYEVADSATAFTDAASVAWTFGGGASVYPATGYSLLPVNQLADLITSAVYGAKRRIDVGTALNVYYLNARQVGIGTTENYNESHIIIDSMDQVDSWITTLADYANCMAVSDGDKYYLVRDWKDSATQSFDANNIQPNTFQLRKGGALNQPNCVEVTYTDTTQTPWADDKVTVYRSGVLNGTLPRRMARYAKQGLVRHSEAYRYGVTRLNASTLNQMTVSFGTFDDGSRVRIGDLINVSYPYLAGNIANTIDQLTFRVTNLTPSSPGYYIINAQRSDSAAYSEDVVQSPVSQITPLPRPDQPPQVTNITVSEKVVADTTGNYVTQIIVSWSHAAFPFVQNYWIEFYQNQEAEGALAWRGPSYVNSYIAPPLVAGKLYVIKVWIQSTVNISGQAGYQTYTPLGKSLPPTWPTGAALSAFEIAGRAFLAWPRAVDIDIDGYEVRVGSVGSTWANATLVTQIDSLTYVVEGLAPGPYRFFVDAIDSVRQYTGAALYQDLTLSSNPNAFLAANYSFSVPQLANMVAVPGGWATEFGDVTFAARFTSALATYTNPLLSYHTSGTSALLTEIFDATLQISGDWLAAFNYSNIDGAAITTIELNTAGGEATKTITGATTATPSVLASATHGYSQGDEVVVANITGTGDTATKLNVRAWVGTVPDANHFSLVDFAGNAIGITGGYTSGGTASRWTWQGYNAAVVRASARFARLRFTTTGAMKVNSAIGTIACNVVTRPDGGTFVSSNAGPVMVRFSQPYNKLKGEPVVSVNTALPMVPVYSLVEVSGGRMVQANQNALRFNGTNSQYVTIPDAAANQLPTGAGITMTVEAWFRTSASGWICSKETTAAGPDYSWGLYVNSAGQLRAYWHNNSVVYGVTNPFGSNDNYWHHAAMTLQRAGPTCTGSLYLDGILVGTVTGIPIGWTMPTSPFGIGARPPFSGFGWGSFMTGEVAEVRLWNIARAQTDILSTMSSRLNGNETGLTGYYRLDVATGTTATDYQTNTTQNNGTLTAFSLANGLGWRPLDGFDINVYDQASGWLRANNIPGSWSVSGV